MTAAPSKPKDVADLSGTHLAPSLQKRLASLGSILKRCASRQAASPKDVHRLRVLTRRCGAILRACGSDAEPLERLRKHLKRLRRAAGAVRDADVHLKVLRQVRQAAQPDNHPALDWMLTRLRRERRAGQRKLSRRWRTKEIDALAAEADAAIDCLSTHGDGVSPDVSFQTRQAALDGARKDLRAIEALHDFRVSVKRLRYVVELEGSHGADHEERLSALRSLQEHLGQVHDAEALAQRMERYVAEAEVEAETQLSDVHHAGEAPPLERLRSLAGRYRRLCDRRHERFLKWWRTEGLAMLRSAAAMPESPSDSPWLEQHTPARNGTASEIPSPLEPSAEVIPPTTNTDSTLFPVVRLAAIDVGSNSIRLLIAEALPDGRLRVIDDEKETTRLATGLNETGALDEACVRRSIEVIGRMAGIARGYGAKTIRAVATSAVRDAANGDHFASQVLAVAGVPLEIISSEDEARLAFRSAAEAFDLSETPAAVVDIGGGSVQIILSAEGAIEQLYPLRLGAVRVTEMFGGAKKASGKNFDKLRKFVKTTLREQVGPLPIRPRTMIGTGGTFSALAVIARQIERPSASSDRAATRVQGARVSRETIRRLIDRLADLPLAARARAPGVPSDRADIIVPGLVVAERIMKHLDVHEVIVHQGGIRAGLLRSMADDAMGVASTPTHREPTSVMETVRRFARSLSYERDHGEHVTSLALSIFDQLAALDPDRPWFTPESRLLLEAAGILHDIGYAIGYARHHKHSEQIIAHSDLPGLTTRQIELIALIARFHRRAEPRKRHPALASIRKDDRHLVRRLAAILRVADGLDRAHSQSVTSIRLTHDGDRLHADITARTDPQTDIWGARRKGGFFERLFKCSLEFHVTGQDSPAP